MMPFAKEIRLFNVLSGKTDVDRLVKRCLEEVLKLLHPEVHRRTDRRKLRWNWNCMPEN
jgi:hypothetical protein